MRLLGAFNLHWYNAYSNLSYSGSLQVQEDALTEMASVWLIASFLGVLE